MIEGHGPWKNFAEIEDELILDELLLLNDMIIKSKNEHFKMLAVLQGADPDEIYADEDDDDWDDNGEELPPEILEHERAWQEKKRHYLENKEEEDKKMAGQDLSDIGLGYSRK